jgi:phenylalanyl-tRNA synthetase beta chain
MKISYQWLKWYIPDAPMPDKLADIFTYHLTEVEGIETLPDGDKIFDLNILPNRAHDLLSHHGVAREVAGQLGIKFNDPTPKYKIPESKPTNLKIEINTPNCRRYMGRIVRNVKVGPSPDWVVAHLASIGQRSINNVVDATNIVMFDCGQPCHAYDLKKLVGEKILIQNSKGEELPVVGRDKIVAKLKDTDMVITDVDKSLALAGVKGGLDSGISDDTTDIVLEVANFDPSVIRKTARRLGLLSDSAKRFENDLSATLCDFGMMELSALFAEMSPDVTFEEIVDVYPVKQEERKISFSTEMINKKLGSSITDAEVETILKNYSYEFTKDGNSFEVVAPKLRLDLNISEDMSEEIGRVYGYDKIAGAMPKISFTPKQNETYAKMLEVRNDLINKGYKEAITYAFADKGEIEVLASASDKNFLRTNLSDGLKKSYEMNKLNAPLLGVDEVKIFEIGNVFPKNGEELHVAYTEKKEIKEMKLDEYIASSEDKISGPRVSRPVSKAAGGPDHEILSSDYASLFKLWSPFPFITRDIAVWVPEGTDVKILEDIYAKNGGELLALSPRLVDTFTKEGRTSYAYRLVFQAMDRTLTDAEVTPIMESINKELKNQKDFEIR